MNMRFYYYYYYYYQQNKHSTCILCLLKQKRHAMRRFSKKQKTRSWETTNLEREKEIGTNMFGTRK